MLLKVGREEEKKRMIHRSISSVTFVCALVLCAGVTKAQQSPPPDMIHPGGPEGDFPPPLFGERMELLGFGGMHGGKVVTGAPFSAVAVKGRGKITFRSARMNH